MSDDNAHYAHTKHQLSIFTKGIVKMGNLKKRRHSIIFSQSMLRISTIENHMKIWRKIYGEVQNIKENMNFVNNKNCT